MEIFDADFVQTIKNIAVFVGLAYSPILFANGVMDVIIKLRKLTGRD